MKSQKGTLKKKKKRGKGQYQLIFVAVIGKGGSELKDLH